MFQDRKIHDCVMCMCAAAVTFHSCLQCTDRALKLYVEIFDDKARQKDRFLFNCHLVWLNYAQSTGGDFHTIPNRKAAQEMTRYE